MKKLLFTTAALTGLVLQSFGQGEVLFNNTATAATKVYVTTNGTSSTDQSAGIAGGALAPGNSSMKLMFALFSAANGVSSVVGNPWTDPNWSFSNQYATNTQTAGRLTAVGPFSATASGGVVVPGSTIGQNSSLLVIGWDVASGGSTLASFINKFADGGLYYGRSGIGSIVMGNGSTPPDTTLFGTTAGQLGGFSIGFIPPVPEPATFALAGLGAAAMLIFRRRK
jgi:hypothetical protein